MRSARFVWVGVASGWLAGVGAAQCPEVGAGFHVAGTNGVVRVMKAADLGQGERMFVGGPFTIAGTERVGYVASWDGAGWDAMDGGFNAQPYAMEVFDDGSGQAL